SRRGGGGGRGGGSGRDDQAGSLPCVALMPILPLTGRTFRKTGSSRGLLPSMTSSRATRPALRRKNARSSVLATRLPSTDTMMSPTLIPFLAAGILGVTAVTLTARFWNCNRFSGWSAAAGERATAESVTAARASAANFTIRRTEVLLSGFTGLPGLSTERPG